MLLRNYIYYTSFFIILFSIVLLIYSIINKNKNICKKNIIVSIVYIAYLITLHNILYFLDIEFGLEIIIISLRMLVACLIYIICIILNSNKSKKLEKCIKTLSEKVITIFCVILIILPAAFIIFNIIKVKKTLNSSSLIVVYMSEGNRSFGDYDGFAYAIGENFCEQFDLGIRYEGIFLKKYLPKSAIEITDINAISDYRITFNESSEDNSITVYKGYKKICKKNNKYDYYNIEFKKAFYIK